MSLRAKKSEIIKLKNDFLKIKLTSPPTKDKANKELVDLLSEYYQVNRSAIKIRKGKHSRKKLIELKNNF